MILYKCDMCGDVVDGEKIYDYEIPRKHKYYGTILRDIYTDRTNTQLCERCRDKIADMFDFVVDK